MSVLLLVFFRSLFVGNKAGVASVNEPTMLDTTEMKKGEIRKTRWNEKEVAVLLKDNLEFFVYINAGDSGNCPLFKEPNGLKDVCTGTRFDFNGVSKGNQSQNIRLIVPPYHLSGDKIIIGLIKNK